jgi:hypothetical protein
MSSLFSWILAGGTLAVCAAVFVVVVVLYALFCAGIRAIRGFLDL